MTAETLANDADVSYRFQGRFRNVYYVVRSMGIYVGAFVLCYYWPLFLEFLIAPPASDQLRFIAGILLTPLGFLGAGSISGRIVFLQHLALLALGAGVAWMIFPAVSDLPLPLQVSQTWTPVMIGVYGLGVFVSAMARIAKPEGRGAVLGPG